MQGNVFDSLIVAWFWVGIVICCVVDVEVLFTDPSELRARSQGHHKGSSLTTVVLWFSSVYCCVWILLRGKKPLVR